MDTIKVVVYIQGRPCPMHVDPREEWALREAGRLINNKIADYKRKHGNADPSDLLAITAIQFTASLVEIEKAESIVDRLREESRRLDEIIEE
jgi:cell division protein ZapA (FtsZ GTPase activity inhibitor)